jgi:cytochrome c-type biogenesis protein CcmF
MSDPSVGPISGFFEGETTSEVGRRDGLGGDIWSAMQPDLAAWKSQIQKADRRVLAVTRDLPSNDPRSAAFAAQAQGLAVRALAKSYVSDPPPANFRVNVNPLVVWIWIGGAIGICGALIALWPSPRALRRRVSDVAAARLARDMGSA